jgi:hypothetical protein
MADLRLLLRGILAGVWTANRGNPGFFIAGGGLIAQRIFIRPPQEPHFKTSISKALHKHHSVALGIPNSILFPRPAAQRGEDRLYEFAETVVPQPGIIRETVAQIERQR